MVLQDPNCRPVLRSLHQQLPRCGSLFGISQPFRKNICRTYCIHWLCLVSCFTLLRLLDNICGVFCYCPYDRNVGRQTVQRDQGSAGPWHHSFSALSGWADRRPDPDYRYGALASDVPCFPTSTKLRLYQVFIAFESRKPRSCDEPVLLKFASLVRTCNSV